VIWNWSYQYCHVIFPNNIIQEEAFCSITVTIRDKFTSSWNPLRQQVCPVIYTLYQQLVSCISLGFKFLKIVTYLNTVNSYFLLNEAMNFIYTLFCRTTIASCQDNPNFAKVAKEISKVAYGVIWTQKPVWWYSFYS
jgi:hypothetical protein